MSTLHIIAKAPSSKLFTQCAPLMKPGDAVMFIEDGIYHAVNPDCMAQLPGQCLAFGLREDLIARGMLERVKSTVEIIGYPRFVEACCKYDKSISWF